MAEIDTTERDGGKQTKPKLVKIICITDRRPWISETKFLEKKERAEVPEDIAAALEANDHAVRVDA